MDLDKLRVLVVEDDPVSREYIVEFLKMRDHDFDVAVDGKDAVEKFESYDHYDFILVDLRLPELNGPEVVKKIRDDEARLEAVVPTHIVALTADASREGLCDKAEQYISGCLQKPISFDTLDIILHQALLVESNKAALLLGAKAVHR